MKKHKKGKQTGNYRAKVFNFSFNVLSFQFANNFGVQLQDAFTVFILFTPFSNLFFNFYAKGVRLIQKDFSGFCKNKFRGINGVVRNIVPGTTIEPNFVMIEN